MAHFDDVVFPDLSRYGTGFVKSLPSQQVAVASGEVFTNALAGQVRRRYAVNLGDLTSRDAQRIKNLWIAGGGPNFSFLYIDWEDRFTPDLDMKPEDAAAISALDQSLVNTSTGQNAGNGSETVFQCVKVYQEGSAQTVRDITKLQDGTTLTPPLASPILVAIAGAVQLAASYNVDLANGRVTFDSAPGNGLQTTWGGAFYVPVKFEADILENVIEGFDNNDGTLVLEEVLGV